MNSSADFRCGDIVFGISAGNGADHIQSGKRYHVVVSNNVGNRFSSVVLVVPLTTRLKKTDMVTHAVFEAGSGGLPKRSMLLAEQPTPMNKADIEFKAGSLPECDLDKLATALVFSLPIVERAFKNGIGYSSDFRKVANA